ncbi:MAG: hypothetical protein J6Q55_02180 [Clostridia bacterium]|nr:hypothetical protein [Clostridia bacterium]
MAKLKVVNDKNNGKQHRKVQLGRLTPQIVAQALVVLAVCGVFIFAMPNLPPTPTTSNNSGYTGVINLWLVDTFEGGSGSRQSWFTKRSARFEEQNKGLFVCVTVLTENQLLDKLQSGQTFDLLCFSRGVGANVLQKLAPIDVDYGNILDNFAQSGRMGNTTYALPMYTGVYCLFARASQQKGDLISNCLNTTFVRKVGKNTLTLQPLVCGFAPYNSPLTALAASGARGSYTPNYNTSQYTAYEQFVENKTAVTLLGTQRDMYRLGKRAEMGKMEQLLFAPLCDYTDLVTYIGVSKDAANISACFRYVQYLLCDEVQQSIADIAMFCVTDQDLYTNDWYKICQNNLAKAFVPNVFADANAINQARTSALDSLSGG